MSVRQNLISACLLILSASLTTPVYARSVTDHLNRTVEVPDHIERVAVADIFPYASAACVYLGSCRKIVAMHPSSMNAARSGLLHELYPEVADINTSVMQGAEVNLEALMGLGPDVVFVNAGNKRLIERLRAARVGLTGNQETTRGVLLEDCRDFIQRLLGVGRNLVTIVYHLVHPHFVSGFTGRPFREHHAQLVTARKSCDINNEKQERFPKIYQNLCSRK